MTRIEKKELKKKRNKYTWIGYSFLIMFFILLISLLTTNFKLIFLTLFSNKGISAIIILTVLFIPIMVYLYFHLKIQNINILLLQEFEILKNKRIKIHVEHFWNAIQEGNLTRAQKILDDRTLIQGDNRILCNGIMLGIATQTDIDKEWKNDANQIMLSYLH